MKLYHGTSFENGMNILKNGFDVNDTIWDCSNCNETYVVSEKHDYGVQFAIEAAQLAAAHFDSQSNSVIIFEFEISDEELEDYFEPDYSCDNMPDCYSIENKYLNKYIASGEIKMTTYEYEKAYVKYLRLFYLPINNQYYTPPDKEIEEILKRLNKNAEHMSMLMIDDYIGQYKSCHVI